jgi:glyoxylase-like metal-dependent hydrolase (beta-lactamase superfamily II)
LTAGAARLLGVWDEVGDGCFRRRYHRYDLNIGVVRGAEALLVLDTRGDLRQADELLDDLATFGQPVRWVVNSHWHFDRVFGNQRFVERSRGENANPTRPTVEVAAELQLWGHVELPPMLLDNEVELRAALRGFYDEEACVEFDRVELVAPDHLVSDRHVLDLGDRGVELLHLGRGHTSNDLVVAAREAEVVFAGDLVEQSAPPAYGDDCYPLEWPATVAALAALGPSTFVPGHGDVMASDTVADQVGAIADVAALIRQLHTAGVAVDDALAEAADQWPFPRRSLTDAVARGYVALGPQTTTR